MDVKQEKSVEQSQNVAQQPQNIADKSVVLSYKQIFTYSVFLITFGASVYTFFKAIPKIESLDKEVIDLNKNVAVFQVQIQNLTGHLNDHNVSNTNSSK